MSAENGISAAKSKPNFKYDRECRRYPDCPPMEGCAPTKGVFYRFFFPDDVPKSLKPPAKVVPRRELEPNLECSDYALSFFISAPAATKRYQYLKKILKEKIKETIGDHLATVTVEQSHGLATRPSKKTGHFELHEFADADLSVGVTIIGPTLAPEMP